VPCGELFDAGNSADGLREFAVPLDDLQRDEQSGALDSWGAVCSGQLFDLPQHDFLDDGSI